MHQWPKIRFNNHCYHAQQVRQMEEHNQNLLSLSRVSIICRQSRTSAGHHQTLSSTHFQPNRAWVVRAVVFVE
jgi:hypothetical protein